MRQLEIKNIKVYPYYKSYVVPSSLFLFEIKRGIGEPEDTAVLGFDCIEKQAANIDTMMLWDDPPIHYCCVEKLREKGEFVKAAFTKRGSNVLEISEFKHTSHLEKYGNSLKAVEIIDPYFLPYDGSFENGAEKYISFLEETLEKNVALQTIIVNVDIMTSYLGKVNKKDTEKQIEAGFNDYFNKYTQRFLETFGCLVTHKGDNWCAVKIVVYNNPIHHDRVIHVGCNVDLIVGRGLSTNKTDNMLELFEFRNEQLTQEKINFDFVMHDKCARKYYLGKYESGNHLFKTKNKYQCPPINWNFK